MGKRGDELVETHDKRIKKKKFYLMFLFMMLSLLLIIITSIENVFIKIVANFLILLIQYLTLDAVFTDYFGD